MFFEIGFWILIIFYWRGKIMVVCDIEMFVSVIDILLMIFDYVGVNVLVGFLGYFLKLKISGVDLIEVWDFFVG